MKKLHYFENVENYARKLRHTHDDMAPLEITMSHCWATPSFKTRKHGLRYGLISHLFFTTIFHIISKNDLSALGLILPSLLVF